MIAPRDGGASGSVSIPGWTHRAFQTMKPERKPCGNRLRVGRWYRLRLWGDLASVDLSPRRVNNGWPNDDGLDATCVTCVRYVGPVVDRDEPFRMNMSTTHLLEHGWNVGLAVWNADSQCDVSHEHLPHIDCHRPPEQRVPSLRSPVPRRSAFQRIERSRRSAAEAVSVPKASVQQRWPFRSPFSMRGLRLRQASRSNASKVAKRVADGFASRAVVLSFVAGDGGAEANARHAPAFIAIPASDDIDRAPDLLLA